MSEKAQINIQQGKKTVRIFCNWGTPKVVLPELRAAAKATKTTKTKATALDIAHTLLTLLTKSLKGTGWHTEIIGEDFDEDALAYRYTVDVSSRPWKGQQTEMPGYELIDRGDGLVAGKLIPAVTRNFRIGK